MALLKAHWDEGRFVCVGLDSDASKLPIDELELNSSTKEELAQAQQAYRKAEGAWERGESAALSETQEKRLADAQLDFNKRIIDATHDLVAAYKPNSAFYEALGPAGWQALRATINYIRRVAPAVVVILDFKRGDIDNTNRGYLMAAAMADAVTVSPYLGLKALELFRANPNKGVFVLCRTSNQDSDEFQKLCGRASAEYGVTDPVFRVVAEHVRAWNEHGNCGLVAGATYPEDLRLVRHIGGKLPMLIPGVGAQGGALEESIMAGVNSDGQGFLLNSSRAIIFADDPRAETKKLNRQITAVLATL